MLVSSRPRDVHEVPGDAQTHADVERAVLQNRLPTDSVRAQNTRRLRPPLVESTGNTGTSRDWPATLPGNLIDADDTKLIDSRTHPCKPLRYGHLGNPHDVAQPEHAAASDGRRGREAIDGAIEPHHAGGSMSEREAIHDPAVERTHASNAGSTAAQKWPADSNLFLVHSRKRQRRISNAYERPTNSTSPYSRPALKRHCTEPSTRSPSLADQLRATGHSFQMSPPSSTPQHSFISSSPATTTLTRQLLPSPFAATAGSLDDDVHIAYRVPVVPPQDDEVEADNVQIRHAQCPGSKPLPRPNHEAEPAPPSGLRRASLMSTRLISARPGLSRSASLLVPSSTASSAFASEPLTAATLLPSSTSTSSPISATSASSMTSTAQAVQALRLRLRLARFKVETKQTDVPMQQCMLTQPKLPRLPRMVAATPKKELLRMDGSMGSYLGGRPRDDAANERRHGKQQGYEDGTAKYGNGRWGGGDVTSSAVKGSAADSLLLLGMARDMRGV